MCSVLRIVNKLKTPYKLCCFKCAILLYYTMPNTRTAPKSAPKPTRLNTTSTPTRPSEAPSATALPDLDDESSALLIGLSEDSKALAKVMQVMFSKQFKVELEVIKQELVKRDEEIANLKCQISDLKEQVENFATHIDSVEQYERNDTVVISGPALPPESSHENTKSLVVSVVKEHLKLVMKEEDISVAHRLGPARQGGQRPVIVKLVNRSFKYDLVGACINLKPGLYINESLTPKRYGLLKKILAVRKTHKQKFQQLFTKDGKIMLKLKNSTVRHTIINEQSLMVFLSKYPEMLDTYNEIANSE